MSPMYGLVLHINRETIHHGAEVCLYLAAAIFAAQALVILTSPAVSLPHQPEMVI